MGERGEVARLRATLEALGPALEARDRQWKAAFLSAKRDARYVSGDILRGASVPMRFAEPTTPWEEFVAPLLEGMLEPAGAPRCLKSVNSPTADDLETAGAPRVGTSKYHGVYISASGSITANITKNGASAYLGTFRSEEAAAKRWDEEARKLGRLKNINFPTADDLVRMT